MEELKLLLAVSRDNVPAVLCVYLVWWGTQRMSVVLGEIRDALVSVRMEIDKCPKNQ